MKPQDVSPLHGLLLSHKHNSIPYLPTPPLRQDMTQAEFNKFEFRVFLLLD